MIKWIVSLNIIFLIGTYIFHSYLYRVQQGNWENGSDIKFLLVEFSLANENVLATWYSSLLFLSVGINFFICYLIQKKGFKKNKSKNLAYGWLFFAGIFALLSLDEMASLHERLGNINALNPLGDYALGWIVLLAVPIFLVIGFMIWFCLLQIKRAPLAVLFAGAGILLFASIPLQEYYEVSAWQAAEDMNSWQRPVAFLILEEGSELFGATFMMISGFLFANYICNAGKRFSLDFSLELNLKLNKRNTVLKYVAGSFILAVLMLALVKNDVLFLEGDHGRRENWFPAATAFFTSLLCLYLYCKTNSSQSRSPKVLFYLSIFSIFISAYYGGNIYAYLYSPTESYYKMFVVVLIGLTSLSLAINLFISVKDLYSRVAIVFWVCLLVPSLVIFNWYSAALAFTGFSVLSVSLLHMITGKVTITNSIPVMENKTN